MRRSQYSAMLLCIRADVPPLLVGPPGVGKSQLMARAAEALGLPLLDLRGNTLAREDLLVPVVVRGKPRQVVLDYLAPAVERPHVLFLDELTTVAPSVQAVFLQLLLDRRVGPHRLAEGCRVAAACNPLDQAPGGVPLAEPTIMRTCVLRADPDAEAFLDWLRGGSGVQHDAPWREPTAEDVAKAKEAIAEFLAEHRELVFQWTDAEFAPGIPMPRPSPRTWEFAARIVAAAGEVLPAAWSGDSTEGEAIRMALSGVVGPEAAAALVGWLPNRQEGIDSLVEAIRRGDLGRLSRASDQVLSKLLHDLPSRVGEWTDLELARLFTAMDEMAKRIPDQVYQAAEATAAKVTGAGPVTWFGALAAYLSMVSRDDISDEARDAIGGMIDRARAEVGEILREVQP